MPFSVYFFSAFPSSFPQIRHIIIENFNGAFHPSMSCPCLSLSLQKGWLSVCCAMVLLDIESAPRPNDRRPFIGEHRSEISQTRERTDTRHAMFLIDSFAHLLHFFRFIFI